MIEFLRTLWNHPKMSSSFRRSLSSEAASKTSTNLTNTGIILQKPIFSRSSTLQSFIKSFPSRDPIGIAHIQKSVFDSGVRPDIMHRAVLYSLGQQRGLVLRNAKSRAETRGSGRKIRPQKGMGMARVGDRRSPTFVGGGRAFPRKFKDYRIGMNRKELDYAVRSSLTTKYMQNQLYLMENLMPTQITGESIHDWTGSAFESLDTFEENLRQHGWLDYKAKNLFILDFYEEKELIHRMRQLIDEALSATIKYENEDETILKGKRKMRKDKQKIRRKARVKVVAAGVNPSYFWNRDGVHTDEVPEEGSLWSIDSYDILKHDNVILSRAALQRIELRYHKI